MLKIERLLCSVLIVALTSSEAFASDTTNLCFLADDFTSENIALPMDDGDHYPETWPGDPKKTSMWDADNGMEYTYRTWHWQAYPLDGGPPVSFSGFAVLAAIYLPSPFANGERDWVRLLLMDIVGPDDDNHHYVYVAPGRFTSLQDEFDYRIGGLDEEMILQATEGGYGFLEDPTIPLAEMTGSNGTDMITDIMSSDGFFEIHTQEESLKDPHALFNDGYDPLFRYMYERSRLMSWGNLSYNGVDYFVIGTANEVRQWQLSLDELHQYQWFWSTFQIRGCLDEQGNDILCPESMVDIAVWDAWYIDDGSTAMHHWNEIGAPPFCDTRTLSNENEWSIEAVDHWRSVRTGINYARTVRLRAPSRDADLYLTAIIDDQEMYNSAFIFPGFWEGSVTVEGTFNGQRVWGTGYLEQWNQTP